MISKIKKEIKKIKGIKIIPSIKYSLKLDCSFMEYLRFLAERNKARHVVWLYKKIKSIISESDIIDFKKIYNESLEYMKTPEILKEEIGGNIVIPHLLLDINLSRNGFEYMSFNGNESNFRFDSYVLWNGLNVNEKGTIEFKGADLGSIVDKIRFLASLGNEDAKNIIESGFFFEEPDFFSDDDKNLRRHIFGYAKEELKKAIKQ